MYLNMCVCISSTPIENDPGVCSVQALGAGEKEKNTTGKQRRRGSSLQKKREKA
jgi:hypothetical protein